MDNSGSNPYSISSYFRPPTERPRSGLNQRGFSLNTHHGYNQMDEFDRNLLGYDYDSRPHQAAEPFSSRSHPHQAEQGRTRLSIPPRGLNYDSPMQPSTAHALGMQGLHSRPQCQPIVPAPRPIQPASQLDVRYPEPTGIFHGAPGFREMQPQSQQIRPSLSAFAYNPVEHQPAAPRSSSPAEISSPSAEIVQRRILQQLPLSDGAPDVRMIEMDEANYPRAPVTPKRQTAGSALTSHPTYTLAVAHAPPIIQGIQLVPVSELPDRFRQAFPFPIFNAVQSKCFPHVFKTNENVVVSAPTGSGKTAILELAVCKLVEGFDAGRVKIIYLAPTKSLCAERVRDWEKKFRHVNLPCALLTGDTDSSEMKAVGAAAIIVTTPEKWDSITRKWKDHNKLLEMVKLVLVDEVHMLKDTRGATLEAVVSRMKTIGTNIRFVALSATVPNSHDVAVWLGRDHTNGHIPAHRETFGEDFRPVKLQKHVHGFDGKSNDFAFDSILDSKLPALIAKYTHKKPMMVFCFTRKSCEKTAQTLAQWWEKCRNEDRAWPAPSERLATANQDIAKLMSCGVAFHHAGLDVKDRAIIEKSFLDGQISVICCTSTLAVGVNLPCHLVVIKNTVGYQDGGKLMEYSGLEVMQMLGRAGRPQFDDSAVAIIMTRSEKVERYKKMVSGQEILESTLHLNLIEHLNSEVGLGTINNVHSAKRWLSSTFLAVRMRQNPNYYKLDGFSNTRDMDEKLEQVCERDINLLLESNLIGNDDGRLSCTEYGLAMSRYMVPFETMKLLLSVPEHATMSQILHIIAQASEFNEQFKLKSNERAAFREINKSPLMKWPIKENITTTAHKVSIMIQAHLAGVELPTEKGVSLNRMQHMSETHLVFERMQRLLRCLIDCRAYDCHAIPTRNALELARSVAAGFWENSPMQLRQISDVGAAAVRRFIGAGINSIEKLENTEPSDIERIMSRNPPYGRNIRNSLGDFPRLTLKADFARPGHRKEGDLVKMSVKANLGLMNKVCSWNRKQVTVTFMAEVSDGTLISFWRGGLQMLQRIPEIVFDATVSTPEDTITCILACDEIVGTIRKVILEPNLPQSIFPKPKPKALQRKASTGQKNTSGKSADDEEFGSDDFDDMELIAAVKQVESLSGRTAPAKDDGFEDIDDFDSPPRPSTRPFPEPEKMVNGKWKCNHECSDGAPTKSGGTCKHLCCREGLDKPRKRSAPKKKNPSDENKIQNDEMPRGKDAAKCGRGTAEVKARVASKATQKKQLKIPTEVIDLAGLPNKFGNLEYAALAPREYRKLHGLHESVQKGSLIKLPKTTTAAFSYANGAKPNLSFLNKGEEDDDDEFGSENSDDFDLPSPSQLFKERLDVVTPQPRSFNSPKRSVHRNYDEFEDSVGNIEAGTTGLQDLIPTPKASKTETVPDVTRSFEGDCFDFDAFDYDDYDYPVHAPSPSKKPATRAPLSLGDANCRSPNETMAVKTPEETPVVKYRRITRDDKVAVQPTTLNSGSDAPVAEQDENVPLPQAAGAGPSGDNEDDDGEWVTLTYGGNMVRKRKRVGNQGPLPEWVLKECPPEMYDEYGDCVEFV